MILDSLIYVNVNMLNNNENFDIDFDIHFTIYFLRVINDVIEFYHTSGSFDFLVNVCFSDIRSFKNFFVDEVASIHNIGDVESQIVLEELKYSTKTITE